MRIRDEVNRALEAERQAKTIGNSLGARVTLRAGGDGCRAARAVPRRSRRCCSSCRRSSSSRLERARARRRGRRDSRAKGRSVRAAGASCPSVSTARGTEGLCDRCVDALAGTSGTRLPDDSIDDRCPTETPDAAAPAAPPCSPRGRYAHPLELGTMAVVVALDQVTKAIVRAAAAAWREPQHHPGLPRSDPRAQHRRGVRAAERGRTFRTSRW